MSVASTVVSGGLNILGQNEGLDENRKYMNKAMDDVTIFGDRASGVYGAGASRITGAFDPYTSAGTSAIPDLARGGYGAVQSQNPILSNYSPDSVGSWLDKLSDYDMKAANRAMEASAISKGGMGGGLAKALSNNAQEFAKRNFVDANNMALNAANTNFGQQQQLYANNADWQKQQFDQQLQRAGMGLNAAAQQQQLLGTNDKNLADVYLGMGQGFANINLGKGAAQQGFWNNVGNIGGQVGSEIGNAAGNQMGNSNAGLLSFLFG